MFKFSKKKLFAFSLIALVPSIVFFSTSCGAWTSVYPKKINVFGNKYGELNDCGKNIRSLLYGGKDFNNGNYILIVGTATNEKLVNLLTGTQGSTNNINDCVISDTIIKTAIDDTIFSTHVDSIAVASYIVNDREVPDKKDSAPGNLYDPFIKWTHDDMHDHDNKSDKDNWQNNHKEDEYARNDTDAKNYRDIYDVINIVQGSTVFSSSDDKGRTFAVIGWHDGFPYSTYFNYANSINTSSFSEWLTACFTWKHS